MEYEGQICRGPLERGSFMMPVTVGCPYNRCRFCNLFTHLKYRELPLEMIEKELSRVRNLNGSPKRIFLGDGSAFSMSFERLKEVLELIHRYFPEVERINADATITSIRTKTDAELKALKDMGINTLYIGVETGLDDVLKYMDKDHGLIEAYVQIERLKKASIEYAAHYMTGVAGHGRGKKDAEALADFIRRTQPIAVVNFSMFISDRLLEDIEENRFTPATELENLKQERRFLETLESPSGHRIRYDGYHDWIRFHIAGILPEDRVRLISKLDSKIAEFEGREDIFASRELTEKVGMDIREFGFFNQEIMGLEDVYIKEDSERNMR